MKHSSITALAVLSVCAAALSACSKVEAPVVSSPEPTVSAGKTTEKETAPKVPAPTAAPAVATPEQQKKIIIPQHFNANGIAMGDYSSAAGTWKSTDGGKLEINGDKILWTYPDGRKFAQITKHDFKSIMDPDGDYRGGPVDDGDLPKGSVLFQWVFDKQYGAHGSVLIFYPAGVPMKLPAGFAQGTVASDQSKDRILALPGNGVGRLMPEKFESYVMVRSGQGSTNGDSQAQKPGDEKPDYSDCPRYVKGGHPCAGGPRPKDAKPIETVGRGYATLRSPSKNIGCEINYRGILCVVGGWKPKMDPNYNPHMGGVVAIGLSDQGPVGLGQKTDAPTWKGGVEGIPAGQILPYGTVWYYGDYVVASEKTGITFWNVKTGFGALIDRQGYSPFGPSH
ncbi:hypothetical protein BSR29_08160 [Boudabousia liubingyangii]|uniref:Lipoprotein n=1 Tax=Boudabousia liubingyangii TaxID=1921764 RepID=A0A1Q5PJU9_9ACTO|nr:hypothetical protein [Boudabousia liubingyangii]OKL46210.1 hypothetical protein BSR29_08160 [Boudabousia liubingyangii]OKL46359.1 hypothetical protein BSR28_07455 [Boudabousia liubingyangii]